MSLVVAMRSGFGEVRIASDLGVYSEDGSIEVGGPKYIDLGWGAAVGAVGDRAAAQVFFDAARALTPHPGVCWVDEYMSHLRRAFADYPDSASGQALIVYQGDLWTTTCEPLKTITATRLAQTFAAIGIASQYAYGFYDAYEAAIQDTDHLLQDAIKSASQRNAFVRGWSALSVIRYDPEVVPTAAPRRRSRHGKRG